VDRTIAVNLECMSLDMMIDREFVIPNMNE